MSSELSPDAVRHIARLARLDLSPDDEAALRVELSAILGYVDKLAALDVRDVPPMTHALAQAGGTPLRADEVHEGLAPEDALAAAPAREGTFFKVPRIIE